TWNRLEIFFHNNKSTRALNLDSQFTNTKLEQFDGVKSYCTRLKDLAGSLKNVGDRVSDNRMALQLLKGLSDEYKQFRTSVRHLKPFPSFAELRSMLELEEQSNQHELLGELREEALLTPSFVAKPAPLPNSSASASTTSNKGGGRKGGKGRGKGKGGGQTRHTTNQQHQQQTGPQQQQQQFHGPPPQQQAPWYFPNPWGYWTPSPWASPPCPYPSQVPGPAANWPPSHPGQQASRGILGPRPPHQAYYVAPSFFLSKLCAN
ncbi:Translation initiation factor IF-2, partial [Bienertia sinuspersici]